MKTLLLAASLIFLTPDPGPAPFSCTGRGLGPPCQEAWFADAVFTGKVEEVVTVPFTGPNRHDWQEYQKLRARISVSEVFRGDVESEITYEAANCYYPFVEGETYLVYAHKDSNGKLRLQIHLSRTRPLAEAQEDIEYLRSLADAPKGGRIYGRVYDHIERRRLLGAGAPSAFGETLPDVKIVAESADRRYETTTGETGEYEFRGLPAGDYRVRAFLAPFLAVAEDGARLSEKGCAPISLSVQTTGEIEGTVSSPDGRPLAQMSVNIFAAEGATEEQLAGLPAYSLTTSSTDETGRFRFVRLPAGRYYVVVNLWKSVADKSETARTYARTFYPNAGDLAAAGAIVLADGEKRRNIVVRMRPAEAAQ